MARINTDTYLFRVFRAIRGLDQPCVPWLLNDPGRHTALTLDVRGLNGIDECPAEPVGGLEQELFVDDEAVRSVRKAHAADRGLDPGLEADARRQAREKESAPREDPPHLVHHAIEARAIAREVQDRAADHGVHPSVGPRQRME